MIRKMRAGNKMIRLAGLTAVVTLVLCGCARTDNADRSGMQEERVIDPEAGWMPIGDSESKNDLEDGNVSQDDGETAGGADEEALNPKQKRVIDGYILMDGIPASVKITMEIENILKGQEAYTELCGQDGDINEPGEGEEYIIITFLVTYDEGEAEEVFLTENRASLKEACLYFALSNSKSNATDYTYCLENSMYNLSLIQGQSAQGSVAFLQEKNNTQPLHFLGFGQNVMFSVNVNRL